MAQAHRLPQQPAAILNRLARHLDQEEEPRMPILQPVAPAIIDVAVRAALREDGADDDVTTRVAVPGNQWGHGVFIVKARGVLAGLDVASAAMTALDATVSFDALVGDGGTVASGTEVADVEGPVAALLAAERVALNFLQRMSGIATLTREFVEAVEGTGARILDTRKTAPGLRYLDRYAVRAGGGGNHRFNLSTAVLIKDNHIAAVRLAADDDVGTIVRRARAAAPHTMRIEIEVTSPEELGQAIEGGADVILLDNMSVDAIAECVRLNDHRAVLEASGGVNLSNVRDIAGTGVDFISVGTLTHSAPSLDISFDLRPI